MKFFKVYLGQEASLITETTALMSFLFKTNCCLSLSPQKHTGYDYILDSPRTSSIETSDRFIEFLTSGTTGQPKAIKKKWNDIITAKVGKGTTKDKWLLCYNPARWAGFSVIMHTQKNKSRLVIPEDLSAKSVLGKMSSATHLSLTPSMFRKYMVHGLAIQPQIEQVTFGGEFSNQKTLDDAKILFPNARISHIYATTELGDLESSSDGIEGFKKLPGDLIDGELVIDGFHTGDLWAEHNGRFIFQGRKQEIINVGGAKVSPIEVEKVILENTRVTNVRVFGKHSTLLGQIVYAEYCGDISELELSHFLQSRLPKYSRPKLKKVDEIHLSEAGKVVRQWMY